MESFGSWLQSVVDVVMHACAQASLAKFKHGLHCDWSVSHNNAKQTGIELNRTMRQGFGREFCCSNGKHENTIKHKHSATWDSEGVCKQRSTQVEVEMAANAVLY